jgi:hypothetical protein
VVEGETMLRIESIAIKDKFGQTYTIRKSQLEFFPLTGGTNVNTITTKVWNQHGANYVDNFMESYDGQLVFIINTANKSALEIEQMRREIAKVCNPLNGILQMKITLNSGEVYNQDIILTSAVQFPIGIENRNEKWQKVQLLYSATNPFYYADQEIEENFKGHVPTFEFPFEMSPTEPIEFSIQKQANIAVNEGQVAAPIKIKIVGTCINPVITNVTTGEFLKFNLTMSDPLDVLEINTGFGEKKVTLNGINVFDKLDYTSTFFNLVIGENEIIFEDEALEPTASIYFSYRTLYITI